jgi:hypothetical protein
LIGTSQEWAVETESKALGYWLSISYNHCRTGSIFDKMKVRVTIHPALQYAVRNELKNKDNTVIPLRSRTSYVGIGLSSSSSLSYLLAQPNFSKNSPPGNETGLLDPRPKILGFHMPSPATHPYMPNKEVW